MYLFVCTSLVFVVLKYCTSQIHSVQRSLATVIPVVKHMSRQQSVVCLKLHCLWSLMGRKRVIMMVWNWLRVLFHPCPGPWGPCSLTAACCVFFCLVFVIWFARILDVHKAGVCAELPLLPRLKSPLKIIKAHGFQQRCRPYTTYICIIYIYCLTKVLHAF